MSIQRLPDSVVDKIKSSSSITSLNGVVCELVKNSLDAGARRINILVDYTRGNCTVEDDGDGIAAEEFQEHGRLAKLHSMCRVHICLLNAHKRMQVHRGFPPRQTSMDVMAAFLLHLLFYHFS